MHKRRKFLEDIKTKLKTLPNYGGVWIQRGAPRREQFPAITLFSDNETVETLTIHQSPREQFRSQFVSVIVWIRGTPDDEKTESDIDNFAFDVETVVTTPTGSDDLILLETLFQFSEDEPDINTVTLNYQIKYTSEEYNPVG